MHDAHNVDMLLHVTSRPIIEDSNQIQVGRFDASVSNISLKPATFHLPIILLNI